MPPRQPAPDASLLSTLMTGIRAKSASLIRFLYDKADDVFEADNVEDDDCFNNIKNYVLFDDIVDIEGDAPPLADEVRDMLVQVRQVLHQKAKQKDKVSPVIST